MYYDVLCECVCVCVCVRVCLCACMCMDVRVSINSVRVYEYFPLYLIQNLYCYAGSCLISSANEHRGDLQFIAKQLVKNDVPDDPEPSSSAAASFEQATTSISSGLEGSLSPTSFSVEPELEATAGGYCFRVTRTVH